MFGEQKGILPATSVSKCLTDIIESWRGFGTITLRDSGGVYWLPEDKIAEWDQLAQAVEQCAVKDGQNKVDGMTTLMDEHTARALQRALVEKVEARASEMVEEMCEGGTQLAENRKQEAMQLDRYVETFEGILSETLDQLHERLKRVEEVATVAALQSMGV